MIYQFTPSTTSNFEFQPILDGSTYRAVINWNMFGQRYYVNIYTLQNALVVCLPLIGSPYGYDISMTAGYFKTKMVYRPVNGNIEVTP